MKTAFYDNQPAVFEAVGNGSYIYRWGIEETTVTNQDETTTTKYKCFEVIVWGTVTKDKITSAVIEAIWGGGIEQKMLNDYNAAKMELLDASYIEKYHAFLIERKAIKEQIAADCLEFGIV